MSFPDFIQNLATWEPLPTYLRQSCRSYSYGHSETGEPKSKEVCKDQILFHDPREGGDDSGGGEERLLSDGDDNLPDSVLIQRGIFKTGMLLGILSSESIHQQQILQLPMKFHSMSEEDPDPLSVIICLLDRNRLSNGIV